MTIHKQLLVAVDGHRGVVAADLLCEACVTIFDVEAAAISLVSNGVNTGTLGASDALARTYDELEFTIGDGPCLESVRLREPVLVVDLADPAELRWPAYRPAMLDLHIRGVFAIPVIVAGECIGALDFFRADPGHLDSVHLAGAIVAAEMAGIPLLDVIDSVLRDAVDDVNTDAWADLYALSRAEVSQATGMLVVQLGVEPAEALVRLRAHAYATGRSARDVACDILERRLRMDAD